MTRYSYEVIDGQQMDASTGLSKPAKHFRIRDDKDNRVATCWDETNARLVVMSMNFAAGDPVDWVCGHNAAACCQECWRELAVKSHNMAEALLESDTIEEARKHVAQANGGA